MRQHGLSIGCVYSKKQTECRQIDRTERRNQETDTPIKPYLQHLDVNGSTEYDGYIQELLEEVGRLTNVDFKIHSLNTVYGALVDGSWTGLVGDVVNKKVELVAAPLTMTSSRNKVLDFSVPFQDFGPVIVMRRPRNEQPSFGERFSRIFAPLSHSVWLMALVAYFITSVVLYIICHCNPYEWRHLYRDGQATYREGESFTCMNAFWFMMSTWMLQGFVRAPRSLGGRLVVTFWWMFIIAFLLTYTASLANLLRVGPSSMDDEHYSRILNFEDLAKQTEVSYGFLGGGSTETYFKNAKVPHLKTIWSQVNKRKTATSSTEKGIEKVRNSPDSRPFAFIMESSMAKYMLRQEPCNLYMVSDLTVSGAYALAYLPGWDLARQVDEALLIMRENGTLKLLEDRWFRGQCEGNIVDPTYWEKMKGTPFYPVDLGSFSGALVILLAGVVAGSLVTVLEIIIFKKAELAEDEATLPMKTSNKQEEQNKIKADNQLGINESVTDV
ncbi:hypothetical protein C0Q70_13975 [Pomacea canaliculata]|uniref:Ionotropic glutamate receptor C-terminal domain-containing protein n=1 Tax=Pomacea canaliculata TaxID=400727 RepID=A0A2T7NYR5_POMCA|nr:hypothetical protein C0Q70_13975 [Pomacea canaliculata]